MTLLSEISEAVISGNAKKVQELIEKAVAEGLTPKMIIDGLISGMNVVGVGFKNNDIYMPEVLVAARAMHTGMDLIKPLLLAMELDNKGTVLLGTVKGDVHDIGKNLVGMMLEGAGYKVIDIGIDQAPESFVNAVSQYKPDIVGLSALLTTTMINMKTIVELLKSCEVKVMIGGAPVTQKFADEIGADAFAPDATSAVDMVNKLLDGICEVKNA